MSSDDRDNPGRAPMHFLGASPHYLRRALAEKKRAKEFDPERDLERDGRFLVYTGPCEPFDAKDAIRQVREERP